MLRRNIDVFEEYKNKALLKFVIMLGELNCVKEMFLLELLEGEKEFILEQVSEILKNNRTERENLVPLLQKVQGVLGYLPEPAIEKIAKTIDIPAVDVFGLATFYNQLRLNPPGKYQIKVCMGTACHMIGGQIILESFERRLDIVEGETTPDRKYSLERVACVGCCAIAPVVVVNEFIEGSLTPTRVDGILLQFDGDDQEEEAGEQEQEQESEGGQDS